MGFEQIVPPIPDRLQELKMMDRLEQSWLDQPYNRYYMQEDLRQTKMQYAKYNLTARRKFFQNTLLVSAISLPLAYLTRRFYVYRSFGASSIPFTKELTYFAKDRTVEFERTKAANKTFVWTWLLTTFFFSIVITDWNYRSDENYDKFSKVKRML